MTLTENPLELTRALRSARNLMSDLAEDETVSTPALLTIIRTTLLPMISSLSDAQEHLTKPTQSEIID